MADAGGVWAVLDTNVLVSGLLWHGPPHALIEQARAGSFIILSELSIVIRRRKFRTILARSRTDPEQMLRLDCAASSGEGVMQEKAVGYLTRPPRA